MHNFRINIAYISDDYTLKKVEIQVFLDDK